MPFSLFNKHNRIARKLTLSVVLASVLITLFTTAYQLYGDYTQRRQSLEERLHEISQVHSRNLATSVWVADREQIKNYLTDILNLPDIQFLEITEGDQTLIQVGEKKLEQIIERSYPLNYSYRGKNIQIGVFHVQASLGDIYQTLFKQSINILSSNALALFLLAGFVLFLFDRLMARHIQILADHAAKLTMHNMHQVPSLDKPVKPGISDELDVLVDAFVRMQSSLLDSIHAVTTSEARTRLILDSAAEAIYGLDLDGCCSFVNPSCVKLLGYSHADELIGKDMHTLIHHSHVDGSPYHKNECALLKATATGELSHSDQDILWRSNGKCFPVEWWSHPIHLDDKLVGAVVTFFDISQRLEVEESMRKAHQMEVDARLTAVVDTAVDGIITINEQGIIETYNKAAATLFGYTSEEAIGHNIKMLMPNHYAREHDQYLANYNQTGHARIIGIGREAAGLRKDGTTFPIELSVAEVKFGERRIFTGMVRDISERQTAQASLTQFKDTLDQTLDCVFMFTADDLEFFYVNRGAAEQVGYTTDELMTMTPIDIKPKLDETQFRSMLGPLLSGEKSSMTFETVHRHKDGHDIHVEISLQYIPRDNKASHFIAIVRDITERRQTQNMLMKAKVEAEQASRAKSAFLAAMSHEIRTPMNGVIGMVDVLTHSNLDDDQSDALSTIRDSAFSLLGLIDDILDFSKIEAGKLELERLAVSVTDIAEGICNALAPVAVDSGVELYLFIDPKIPAQVWSDPTRLRQILYNLIGNAIKFSVSESRQGRVEVRITASETSPLRLQFSISDNGIGMSEDTKANLFSSFSQAETSTTRRFGGTGLGLAISGRLIKLMHGRIDVASSLKTGSDFTVTLPVEKVSGSSPPELPDLSGLHCIVAVDSPIMADDLRTYLVNAGAFVQLVNELDEAARLTARQATPPIVIHRAKNQPRLMETLQRAFASQPEICHLLITGGKRRSARVVTPNLVILDGDALRQQALLRAVAVTAGKASPEIFHPIASKNSLATETYQPTIAEARAQGKLILVAEDDEINRKVILMQLAMLGYAAEVAKNGIEALQLWRKGNYAVLLTDLHMPEMDGYQLTEIIRQEETEQRHMPIIALTANALHGEQTRARQVGMDDYLTKPVQLHMLTSALENCITEKNQPACATASIATKRTEPAFDVSVLKALVGDDDDTIDGLLLDYLNSASKLATELSTAHVNGDSKSILATVHKLKSASRSVGAGPLGDLCTELENACTTKDQTGTAKLTLQFEQEFALVETKIKDHLNRQHA